MNSSEGNAQDAQALFGAAQDTGFSNERTVNEMLHDSSQRFFSALMQHKLLHLEYSEIGGAK
jgi:hypothetical protein